ncbi:MAG: hypothetical protein AAF990_12870 [Bacteroidota bacterium]
MKKFFLLFAFLGFVSFAANAQSCGSKKMSKTACAKTCTKTAAAKLASLSDDIESRTCTKSGKVSYVRKQTCPSTGSVSFVNVEYCSKSQKFINVSPSATSAKTVSTKKKSCSMTCTKSAKTVKATTKKKVTAAKLVKNENEK